MFGLPLEIVLYDEAPGACIDVGEMACYLRSHLPSIRARLEGPYFSGPDVPVEKMAEEFARARVRNVFRRTTGEEPLFGEIEYERRRLEGRSAAVFGIPYDGLKVQQLASRLLPTRETPELETRNHKLETVPAHLIFTNQLLGTWDADDRRFHLRAAIYGFPSLISTSGMVEAPAKPRGYYYLRDRLAALGQSDLAAQAAAKEFAGSFLVHGDERLAEVAKGYVMQAFFFHATGDPFCGDPSCRLFNAHWQEELLRSQLTEPEFCERHARLLEQFKDRGDGQDY